MFYDTVNSAETALGELSQLPAESGTSNGLQPRTGKSYVFSYYWADNFNKKVESDTVGMIDSTHMIKFQEETDCTEHQNIAFLKLPKKRTKFVPTPVADIGDLVVKKKANPKKLDKHLVLDSSYLI